MRGIFSCGAEDILRSLQAFLYCLGFVQEKALSCRLSYDGRLSRIEQADASIVENPAVAFRKLTLK